MSDFTGATFAGADLCLADLSYATLVDATLNGANLTGATLSFSDLTSAQAGGSDASPPAILSYAVLQNVTLDQADLFGADCSSATINGAATTLFSALSLQGANFANAYLEGISLQSSNLQGVSFDGACLLGVDFTATRLDAPPQGGMAASFVAACLQGATFTNAVMTGTNLANAAISFEPGELPTRYCTANGPSVKPPGTFPVSYEATTALDDKTLAGSTICPNGSTYAANKVRGVPLVEMLRARGAPTSWEAAACLVPGPRSIPEPAPQPL
jgi:uncharacterized protein YjbI with pentapeptide repeats